MRWSLFSCVTIAIVYIVCREWPRIKSRWDKAVFVLLISAVWGLFMLDLPRTPGPPAVLQFLFKPFKGWTEP